MRNPSVAACYRKFLFLTYYSIIIIINTIIGTGSEGALCWTTYIRGQQQSHPETCGFCATIARA